MPYLDPPEFYAPWPKYGKKLSFQWGEIRQDTETLKVLARSLVLDQDTSQLINSAVAGEEVGQQGFHNKYRTFFDKTYQTFNIQYNTGTEAVPIWVNYLSIDNLGTVTVGNKFYVAPLTVEAASDTGFVPPRVFNVEKLKFHYPDFYITKDSVGNPIVNVGTVVASSSGTISGGTSLGGTEPVFAGTVGPNLTFKGLTAGTGVSLSSDANSVTINSSGGSANPGFYGINVGLSNDTPTYKKIKTIKFLSTEFYLNQNSPNIDEVVVNLKPPVSSGSGTITGGTALGGTTDTFAGTVGPNLTFRGISAGTGISVSQNASTITVVNTGPTLSDIGPGFYGIGVIQSDNRRGYTSIDTLSFEAANFYLTRSATDTDKVQINLRPPAGTAGGGTITGGTSLGGTEPVFAGTVTTNLTFKGLTAGTGVSLSSDANSITINSSGGAANPGFYGINVGLSNDTPTFKKIKTLKFLSTEFYLNQNSPNIDEVVISTKFPAGGIRLAETNTPGQNFNNQLALLVNKAQGFYLHKDSSGNVVLQWDKYNNVSPAFARSETFGLGAVVGGTDSLAIGTAAISTGNFNTVIGAGTKVSNKGGTANTVIGYNASATSGGTAIGFSATTTTGTVIGANSSSTGGIAIGSGAIGSASGVAIGVSVLGSAGGTIVGALNTTSTANTEVFGASNTTGAVNSVIIGNNNTSSDTNTFIIGANNLIDTGSPTSIVIGNNNTIDINTTGTIILGANIGPVSQSNSFIVGPPRMGIGTITPRSALDIGSGTARFGQALSGGYYLTRNRGELGTYSDTAGYQRFVGRPEFIVSSIDFYLKANSAGLPILNLRPPAGAAGGGTITGGASLGGTEPVFASTVAPTLNFKGLTAGSGVSLSSDANSITISAPGAVPSPGFYGVIFTDGLNTYRKDKLSFSSTDFYLMPDSQSKPVASIRNVIRDSGNQVLSGSLEINVQGAPEDGGRIKTVNGVPVTHNLFIHDNAGFAFGADQHGGSSIVSPGLRGYTSEGTATAPTPSSDGNIAVALVGHLFDGIDFGQAGGIKVIASGAASSTSTAGKIDFATTPTGSTTQVSRMVLTAAGTLDMQSATRVINLPAPAAGTDAARFQDIGPGFYGIGVTQSDNRRGYSGIDVLSFEAANFYITRNATDLDKVQISLRPPVGGGSITGGTSLGGTEPVFAGVASTNLTFKGLTAGTGVSLSSDANSITINSSGGAANPGFYGINVGLSNDNPTFKKIKTIKFLSTEFYLNQNSPNTDEVVVALKAPGGITSPNLAATGTFGALNEWAFTHNLNTSRLVWSTYQTNGEAFIPHKVDVSNPNIAYFYLANAVAGSVTIVASGGTAVGGGSALTVKDGVRTYSNVNTIYVNRAQFYLSTELGQPLLNLTEAGTVDQITFQIDNPQQRRYFFDSGSFFNYTVEAVRILTDKGEVDLGFYINNPARSGRSNEGSSIVGLDPITGINRTPRTIIPTGANSQVLAGGELFMSLFYVFNTTRTLRGNIKIRKP